MKLLHTILIFLISCHLLSAQDPILHFQFDNNFNDSSGNDIHGQNVGTIFCEDHLGLTDEAINFQGNQHVYIGDNLNLGTQDFSISTWINVNEFIGSIGGNNGSKIFNKGLTTSGTPSRAGYGIRAIRQNNLNKIRFEIAGANQSIRTIEYTTANVDQWYHVTCVRNGTVIRLYSDCELVASLDVGSILNVDTDMPAVLGCMHRGPSNYLSTYYKGKIDDFKIYNYALTESEIIIDCEDETALPLEYTNFELSKNADEVYLEWETAEEFNVNQFVIERSENAMDFKPLSTIISKGNSSKGHYYSYCDKNLKFNKTLYYRLKQINHNGDYSYSIIKSIYFTNETKFEITIAPTLVKKSIPINITFTSINNSTITFLIVNNLGKVISEYSFEINKGENSMQIPSDNLENGIYHMVSNLENSEILGKPFVIYN